ncbi:Cytochrome P450 monooxygenase 151 [Psilocybe cubensis]|uniref:Cytochrome P450 monooxygenase 151 n=1 Tax=Psilocybe cubensis TaxID=181762 RepID=A0ACB8HFT8_PSICU|nr:Cytochrome P450 monooxygenase 151 [Psilocybe cubensis]KAH9486572.1 Cytochrome P450 monooxygenase 151 [Psilocybe cubensis]
MDVEGGHSSAIFFILFGGLTFYVLLKSERTDPNLRHIPTLGFRAYLLSYVDALRFIKTCPDRLRKGYDQYRTTAFKVATWTRWLVVITGTRALEELRKSSDEHSSFIDASTEPDASLYLSGHAQAVAPQIIGEITRSMTQNLAFLIPSIKEEVALVLNSAIPATKSEVSMGTQTRDEQYEQISMDQAREVYGYYLNTILPILPRFMSRFARAMSITNRRRRRLRSMIISSIRQKKEAFQHSNQEVNEERLQDALSWTLSDASNQIPTQTNWALIKQTFGHVLYHLAANPKFAAPLRKEVEQIVAREGWNKHSLDRMLKVDSFVKESMRMSNISSDGTQLPTGTIIAAASRARHMDPAIYNTPDTFDGLRFSKLHEQRYGDDCSGSGLPFQLVTTTTDYLVWGYGRHACPGRFFVAVTLKMMLAYVVLHYDVRFENGTRPRDFIAGTNYLPDPDAKILFRKRKPESNYPL